jgi:hypothetical protein
MSDLAVVQHRGDVRAEDFLPVLSVQQAVDRKEQINRYIAGVMKEGEDYGYMPGDNRKEKKRVLLKPGAEKLCSIFGLSPRYVVETQIEDWTGKDHGNEPLFYYQYRCQLWRGDKFLGEGIGSANSWEQKHRYRWLREDQLPGPKENYVAKGGIATISEPKFAVTKSDTTGQYAKPLEYWALFHDAIAAGTARSIKKDKKGGGTYEAWEIEADRTSYRVPNPDAADLVNTLQKMAQKRAQVAAVLVVTNCSDAFTQDVEDTPEHVTEGIDTGGHAPNTQAAADHVRDSKLKEDAELSQLPPEIQRIVAKLAEPGYLVDGLRIIKDQLKQALPNAGKDEYTRILKKHGWEKGKGINLTVAIARSAILEMYQVIKFAKEQAAQTVDGVFHATDDDVPLFKDAPAFDPMSKAEVK